MSHDAPGIFTIFFGSCSAVCYVLAFISLHIAWEANQKINDNFWNTLLKKRFTLPEAKRTIAMKICDPKVSFSRASLASSDCYHSVVGG